MKRKYYKTLVIIPARGGSKRLPKKNLIKLNGKPLIEHSIYYAKQNLDIVNHIIVSTDDEAIKTIALKNNVGVVDRPKELAGENASTVSALKHVLESINQDYDLVVLLQPTNPLRPISLLKDALKKFKESGCDSLMTVSRNHQKFGKLIDGKFVPYNYTMGQRSQDLEPLFYENGLLYITKALLIMNNNILGDNNVPFIIDHPYAKVDIDTGEDFKYAEFILKNHPNE